LEKKALKEPKKSKKPPAADAVGDAPENTELPMSKLIRAVELKAKKATSSLEKKKDKITKGRHGGSKKESILGKAVAARV